MIHSFRLLLRVTCLFGGPLVLTACQEPLQCTSTSVVERLDVKLDREINENVLFLAPHEPSLSRFDVDAIAPSGTDGGALSCTARFHAVLDASGAFARKHGFRPPDHARNVERTVRFTAHRGAWDTYVEVVGLDPLPAPAERAGGPPP